MKSAFRGGEPLVFEAGSEDNVNRYDFNSGEVMRTMFLVMSGMIFVAANLSAQQASDWTQFRGPGGMGVSPVKGLPLTWSSSQNVVWKTTLPGPGASSPVVLGDKIFLTCFTGFNVPGKAPGEMSRLVRHVVCINRADGKILWTNDVTPELPEQASIRDNHGYASSTLAVDSERIYAFFGKSGAYAFDHAGKQLWRTPVGNQVNGFGSGASPILFENLLIVNASVESQSVVGLDQKTGKEIWRAPNIREAWNTPTLVPVGGKTELVVGTQGRVIGLDPANGQQLWTCNNEIGWYIVPSVVAHGGEIWSIGGRSGVVAVALKAGGRGNVTESHRHWTSTKGSNVSSPIIHEGHLYWANDNLSIAYCADAKSGKIVYEERLPGASQIYASPVLADGKLYYLSRTGQTFVLPAQPKFEILAVNVLGERSMFNASPAVAGNRLFIRSDASLYCLGAK